MDQTVDTVADIGAFHILSAKIYLHVIALNSQGSKVSVTL